MAARLLARLTESVRNRSMPLATRASIESPGAPKPFSRICRLNTGQSLRGRLRRGSCVGVIIGVDAESNLPLNLFGVDPRLLARYDFDRILRASTNRSNPYLIDNYASCKTPNADRDACCRGSGSFFLPIGKEAGRGCASENCSRSYGCRPHAHSAPPKVSSCLFTSTCSKARPRPGSGQS